MPINTFAKPQSSAAQKEDPLYDTVEAANYYGNSPGTLTKWRSIGRGPDYVKIGKLVRYRKSALDDHLFDHSFKKGEVK